MNGEKLGAVLYEFGESGFAAEICYVPSLVEHWVETRSKRSIRAAHPSTPLTTGYTPTNLPHSLAYSLATLASTTAAKPRSQLASKPLPGASDLQVRGQPPLPLDSA